MVVVWIILLILSLVVYALLMAYVLPRSFLKTEYIVGESNDRGLKNVKETTGRTIVYQPAMKYRKYVSQYLISERRGRKILKCKVEPNVKYLDYDVVLFNGVRKAFNVINVKELTENGYTEELTIDNETAYVSLVINGVNDTVFSRKTLKPVSRGKITTYILACTGLTILQVFLIKLCCSYVFGGVFREIFMVSTTSTLVTVLFAVIAVAMNLTFILSVILKSNRQSAGKGEGK